MNRTYIVLYLTLLSLDIIGNSVVELKLLHLIAKPLLMPILIIAFLRKKKQYPFTFIQRVIALALFFSWLGDVLLMFVQESPLFFMLGLASFLLAHVTYIIGFTRSINKPLALVQIPSKHLASFGIIISFSVGYFYWLSPNLGELFIPVLIYVSAITIMALVALRRYNYTSSKSFVFVFLGALLFLASDALLAFNKFVTPLTQDSLLIMSTYGFAQLFIVLGMIEYSQYKLQQAT